MKIGNRDFDLKNNGYIMGILNFTPDSFSDGGKFNELDAALKRVEQMIKEGMDILDIGGESTRPGYTKISDEEEIERVVPIIEAVKQRFDIPVSLDTYKHRVAKAGIQVGADLINDIWGLKYDNGEMARVIAESGLPCCLMHNRNDMDYNNFIDDMVSDLEQTVDIALKQGIAKDRIILDPGVGFAKSYENNLETVDRLDEICCRLDYPILLGTSRKSMIGLALALPSNERVEGTVATTVLGAYKGACIFRVHDVKENARALKMTLAIMKGYKNG